MVSIPSFYKYQLLVSVTASYSSNLATSFQDCLTLVWIGAQDLANSSLEDGDDRTNEEQPPDSNVVLPTPQFFAREVSMVIPRSDDR